MISVTLSIEVLLSTNQFYSYSSSVVVNQNLIMSTGALVLY